MSLPAHGGVQVQSWAAPAVSAPAGAWSVLLSTVLTSCSALKINSTCSTAFKPRMWASPAASPRGGRMLLSPHGNGERIPAENVLILPSPHSESVHRGSLWAGEDGSAHGIRDWHLGPFQALRGATKILDFLCTQSYSLRACAARILDVVDEEQSRVCLVCWNFLFQWLALCSWLFSWHISPQRLLQINSSDVPRVQGQGKGMVDLFPTEYRMLAEVSPFLGKV